MQVEGREETGQGGTGAGGRKRGDLTRRATSALRGYAVDTILRRRRRRRRRREREREGLQRA